MQIYGKNVAIEKLKSNDKINKVYLSNKFNDKEILNLLEKRNINAKMLDNRDLDKMCKGLHQGIILDVEDVKTYTFYEVIPHIDKEYPSTRPNRNISFISPPPILSLLNSLSPSNFIIYMVAKAKTADSTFSAVKVNP